LGKKGWPRPLATF